MGRVDAGENFPFIFVSRRHCTARMKSRQDDSVELVDLNSTNGTFVNGVRVAGSTPITLFPGHTIVLGANGHGEAKVPVGGTLVSAAPPAATFVVTPTMELRARMTKPLTQELAAKDALLVEKDASIAEKAALLVEKDASIAEKAALLVEKDASIAEKAALLAEKDASIAEKAALLVEKDARIRQLVEREKTRARVESKAEVGQAAGKRGGRGVKRKTATGYVFRVRWALRASIEEFGDGAFDDCDDMEAAMDYCRDEVEGCVKGTSDVTYSTALKANAAATTKLEELRTAHRPYGWASPFFEAEEGESDDDSDDNSDNNSDGMTRMQVSTGPHETKRCDWEEFNAIAGETENLVSYSGFIYVEAVSIQ